MTYQEFLAKLDAAILTPLMILLTLAATLYFTWGVVQFIINAGDEEKRLAGQRHMIWGIIGLVIMFGANAIIALIKNTVGVH